VQDDRAAPRAQVFSLANALDCESSVDVAGQVLAIPTTHCDNTTSRDL
jgi:hypothetical protein